MSLWHVQEQLEDIATSLRFVTFVFSLPDLEKNSLFHMRLKTSTNIFLPCNFRLNINKEVLVRGTLLVIFLPGHMF